MNIISECKCRHYAIIKHPLVAPAIMGYFYFALTPDELYLYRCLALAKKGAGLVAPNPMVGAVLVYNNCIIGEGYHQQYGQAHAEVNCINSVKETDKLFIRKSTLYVSLEPCAHQGKTPPCTHFIIAHKIPRVVIGSTDPFSAVNGKGIAALQAAGVEVVTGILEKDSQELNKRFFTFHTQQRPYIILKWAQTNNHLIAGIHGRKLQISNPYTNKIVHRWRSEEAGILIGTRTALADQPALTNRLWKPTNDGNPIRLVIDKQLQIPTTTALFNNAAPTIVFNQKKHEQINNILYYLLASNNSWVKPLLNALFQLSINSVLVEGGAQLLQSFINENLWDEARVITNTTLHISEGIQAPTLASHLLTENYYIEKDQIAIYHRQAPHH
jgi:diaminohydroxyphosphoribosylaminopyrimidine deaminase / 5-amino-6-(5-phosphoribosylamino)uracil reductase